MKLLCATVIILLLIGCSGKKTVGDVKRFRESASQTTSDGKQLATTFNSEVYTLIDTAKVYRLVASYYKYDKTNTNAVAAYNLKKYLKFYSEGRLAVFDDFDLQTLDTLRPQITDQGYYEYTFKTLYTRNYLTNADGQQFYNPQWHEMRGDTLLLYSQSTKYTSLYLPIPIPKTVFVDKADW